MYNKVYVSMSIVELNFGGVELYFTNVNEEGRCMEMPIHVDLSMGILSIETHAKEEPNYQ